MKPLVIVVSMLQVMYLEHMLQTRQNGSIQRELEKFDDVRGSELGRYSRW